MIRLIIAGVMTAAGALTGCALAERKLRDAQAFYALSRDVKLLREMTLTKRVPLREALFQMNTDILKEAGARMKEDARILPEEALSDKEDVFSEAKQAIAALFRSLAALSAKDHAREYEKCLETISDLENACRKEGREKRRLYSMLGALFALSAGIFLL